MEFIAYGVTTVIFLGVLIYAVIKSGSLTRGEKRQLEENTKRVQRQDDDQKNGRRTPLKS